jgi:hypothetical protein
VVLLLALPVGCSDDEEGTKGTIGSTTPREAVDFCSLGETSFDTVGIALERLEAPLRAVAAGDYAGAVEPVEELYDALGQAETSLQEFRDTAPPDVEPQVDVLAGAYLEVLGRFPPEEEFVGALEAGDAARITAVLEEIEAFDASARETAEREDVRTSGQEVRTYVEANCTSTVTSLPAAD